MEPSLYSGISPMVGFLVGVVSGLGLVGLWRGILLRVDRRATQKVVDTLLGPPYDDTPQDRAACERIEACKRRLRLQKTLNPKWKEPLSEEIPKLIQEIAEIYYPDAEEPIWAPDTSHFARAIHFAAMDIANFLQDRRIGRLIDVSAGNVRKIAQAYQWLEDSKCVKILSPYYERVRPVWQAINYKSQWMWAWLLLSNAAVRILQPAIIDIVARRAIELYSGRLTSGTRYSGYD